MLPVGLQYVRVAASKAFGSFPSSSSFACLSDGTIAAWGSNSSGQCNVPAPPPGLSYVEVAGGGRFAIARLSDGTAVAWGDNYAGQCTVPPLPPGTTYVQVAAGLHHSVARLSDGSIAAWGDNGAGQCTVPPPPAGLSYVGCAAGDLHTLGLLSDGTITAWGDNYLGQCSVPSAPPGLSYVGVAAGSDHSLGILNDGSVVAWGGNSALVTATPQVPAGYRCTQVAGGREYSVALIEPIYVPFCLGDGSAAACPCANNGSVGHGCENSVTTGGALLGASGTPSLSADTLLLQASGELPHAPSIVLQGGSTISPVLFGDGLRCVSALIKRMYVHAAVGGSVSAPQAGDLSISARSAALGDPIAPGARRYYQVYYRDPSPAFCPAPSGSGFNISNGLIVYWGQ